MRFPVAPHPCQHLVSFSGINVPDFSRSDRCVVVSLVVLICISWTTYDVEHLLICLLAICISSLTRYLSKLLAYFLTNHLFSYCFKSYLYIFYNSPLSDVSLANMLLPACGLSSHSLDIVFHRAEVFYLNEVQLIHCFFHESCLWCYV